MRIAFVQWPDGLVPDGPQWSVIAQAVAAAAPELLITNEMPFGPWIAAESRFRAKAAKASVAIHDAGLVALHKLHVPFIISSRPVEAGDRLANEAFLLDHGSYRFIHQKHFFPNEEGWYEAEWFRAAVPGFALVDIGGVSSGVLLCTELMFNERARNYGRSGAHLIAIPRATGSESNVWKTAGAMAAITSGAYVVSSNRFGSSDGGPIFDGGGFVFAPDGSLLAETSSSDPLYVFDLDPEVSNRQKNCYPVYVEDKTPQAI